MLGSLSTGRLIGLAVPDGPELQLDASSVHVYFGGSTEVFATAGLQRDAEQAQVSK